MTKFRPLLVGLLTIAFVILKLCSVVAWSWWWVLSPLWISAGLWLLQIAILGLIAAVAYFFMGGKSRR